MKHFVLALWLALAGWSAFGQARDVRTVFTLTELAARAPAMGQSYLVLGDHYPGDWGGAKLFFYTNSAPTNAAISIPVGGVYLVTFPEVSQVKVAGSTVSNIVAGSGIQITHSNGVAAINAIGGGGGGGGLVGVRGDLTYHDGTNWVTLAHPQVNGQVLASLNGLPVWAEFDPGDINFLTKATPFTNITTAARLALSLTSSNAGHTVFDTDLKGLMSWSGTGWTGYPYGMPWAPELAQSHLALVAGVLRQNPTNRAIWNFITNSTHRPIGFGGDFAIASGNTLTLSFGRNYGKAISFAAFADETFAGGAGAVFGARVTTSNAVISAGSFFAGSWVVRYTGTAWSVTSVSGSDVQPTVSGYTNGVLRIAQDYQRGANVFLSPWSNSGGNYGYLPLVRSTAGDYTEIEWIDPTTGVIVTSASPLWRMTAAITRRHYGPLDLDGSNGSDSLQGVDTAVDGNIWVMGLFEY